MYAKPNTVIKNEWEEQVLKVIALLAAGLLTSAALAKDPEYPTLGSAYHTTENSALQYSCMLVGAELQCEMAQIFIRKQLKDEEIEKRSTELWTSIVQEKVDKKECEELKTMSSALKEGLKNPEKLKPEQRKTFEAMPKAQADAMLTSVGLAVDVCSTGSFAAKQALRDFLLKAESESCRVGTHTWNETFTRERSDKGTVWISKGKPTGVCRVVQMNRFELEKSVMSSYWNYVSRKVITNPDASEPLLGKCSGLDEGRYLYSWKSRDIYMQCSKINFSPF